MRFSPAKYDGSIEEQGNLSAEKKFQQEKKIEYGGLFSEDFLYQGNIA